MIGRSCKSLRLRRGLSPLVLAKLRSSIPRLSGSSDSYIFILKWWSSMRVVKLCWNQIRIILKVHRREIGQSFFLQPVGCKQFCEWRDLHLRTKVRFNDKHSWNKEVQRRSGWKLKPVDISTTKWMISWIRSRPCRPALMKGWKAAIEKPIELIAYLYSTWNSDS